MAKLADKTTPDYSVFKRQKWVALAYLIVLIGLLGYLLITSGGGSTPIADCPKVDHSTDPACSTVSPGRWKLGIALATFRYYSAEESEDAEAGEAATPLSVMAHWISQSQPTLGKLPVVSNASKVYLPGRVYLIENSAHSFHGAYRTSDGHLLELIQTGDEDKSEEVHYLIDGAPVTSS